MLVAHIAPLIDSFAGVATPAPAQFEPFPVGDAFRVVDLVGVFANAMLGGVIARAERLDLVGFATLAILSGLGGGMIRDVLLQQGPPLALVDPAYLVTALAGATLTFLLTVEGKVWESVWPLLDAMALGSWAAAGALRTLSFGFEWVPAILLGTITAVGGGALRDVVLRRTPTVLGGNTLYATCAVAAAGVMVLCVQAGQPDIGLVVATAVGAGLSLLARRYGWILPTGDAWSPKQVVPRRARSVIRARRATLHRRAAAMRRRTHRSSGGEGPRGSAR